MKITLVFLVLALSFVCAACFSFHETRVATKMTEQGRAFEAADSSGSEIPKGYSDLFLTIAFKTLREDPYLMKTTPTRSSDYAYRVTINIDGQGAEWSAQCQPDKQERYSGGKHNPEGGEGLRCSLIKRLRLKSGTHLFYVALAEDKLEREVRVTLKDGETNNMELRPVYGRNRPFGTDFIRGIKDLEGLLNGRMIDIALPRHP